MFSVTHIEPKLQTRSHSLLTSRPPRYRSKPFSRTRLPSKSRNSSNSGLANSAPRKTKHQKISPFCGTITKLLRQRQFYSEQNFLRCDFFRLTLHLYTSTDRFWAFIFTVKCVD